MRGQGTPEVTSEAAISHLLPNLLWGNWTPRSGALALFSSITRADRLISACISSRCSSAFLASLPWAMSGTARAWRVNWIGSLRWMTRVESPWRGPESPPPRTMPSAARCGSPAALPIRRPSQPSVRFSSESDPVSQISMLRKCERLGWG